MIKVGPFKRPENHFYKDFDKIFRMNLVDYWDPATGFKLIEFDKAIGTPSGVRTSTYIKKHYGDNAVSLIESLLE